MNLTNGARAYSAKLLKDALLKTGARGHYAIGSGEDWWGENQAETLSFVDDVALFSRNPSFHDPIEVKSVDESVVYQADLDYQIISPNRITRLPQGAIPFNQDVRVTYRAAIPHTSANDTGLINEIGRSQILSVDFVAPYDDFINPPDRFVVVDGTRFGISEEPTPRLYIEGEVDQSLAPNAMVREIGIFVDPTPKPELPVGHLFYTPDQLDDGGVLIYALNRRVTDLRNADDSQSVSSVKSSIIITL